MADHDEEVDILGVEPDILEVEDAMLDVGLAILAAPVTSNLPEVVASGTAGVVKLTLTLPNRPVAVVVKLAVVVDEDLDLHRFNFSFLDESSNTFTRSL